MGNIKDPYPYPDFRVWYHDLKSGYSTGEKNVKNYCNMAISKPINYWNVPF